MHTNYKDKLFETFGYSLICTIICIGLITTLAIFDPFWKWFWGLNIFIKFLFFIIAAPGYTFLPGIIVHFFIYGISFLLHIFTNFKEFYKNIFYYWLGLFTFIFLSNLGLLLLAFIFTKFGINSIAKNFLTAFYLVINLKYVFFIFSFVFLLRILHLAYQKFDNFCVNCRLFNRPQLFIICFVIIVFTVASLLNP